MAFKFLKKIFANLNIKIQSPQFNMQPTLLNMPEELYRDALFFINQERASSEMALQLRYRRMALICFCASTEAWINGQLRGYIKQKTALTDYEQKVLDFIETPTASLPKNFLGIRKRLYLCVGEIFTGTPINWTSQSIVTFEHYIELTESRNAIMHYATKNRELVYDTYFGNQPLGITKSVSNAPQIIYSLFNEIHSLNNHFEIPSWL